MNSTLWSLDPHTEAKHTLLKLYLDRWFPIMGKYNNTINYIDGFAGPGQYAGGEKGSPILAVESAMKHVAGGALAPNVTVNFIFVESDRGHAAHLRQKLDELGAAQQFKIQVIDGAFRDSMEEILGKIEAENKALAPT